MAHRGCSLRFKRLYQSAASVLLARQRGNPERISTAINKPSGIGAPDETGFRNYRTAGAKDVKATGSIE
jgi:hypothetical protein